MLEEDEVSTESDSEQESQNTPLRTRTGSSFN